MHLGVFSNQRLNPWVNWTTLGPPLLGALAGREGATLIASPPLSWKYAREWPVVFASVRSADTLFWMQSASRPEVPIHIPALLPGRVRRSAFVVDAWKQLVGKIGTIAILQGLDPCFVAFREGYYELKRRFPGGRFEWLPFGVDTDVFDAVPGKRPIFAYWMGRRYEALHKAMISYCSERHLEYRYTKQMVRSPIPAN